MTRAFSRAAWIAAAGLAAALATPAGAATCTVSPQGVSFGAYDTLSAAPLDGVGNVNVSCDAPVSFTVSLTAGGGSYEQRLMTGGASHLSYNLYTDATRTAVWGDGIGSGNVSATGENVDLSVYGRIPARQNVPASAYSDVLTVTVEY